MRPLTLALGLMLVGFAQHSLIAQTLDEIVVTGTRIQDDYYGMPAVTLSKKADFLVQEIRLVNDSRSPDLRKEEILKTIEELIRRSNTMAGMALSYGDGFLMPIELNDESLQLLQDNRKVDTSYVDIFAKVQYQPNKDSKEQIGSLKEFIGGVKKVGRTEIDVLGDIGLSIVNPEQYRYEIIKAIANENKKLKSTLSENCEIQVSGLERRVQWERSSLSELTLYIPYEMEVSNCL